MLGSNHRRLNVADAALTLAHLFRATGIIPYFSLLCGLAGFVSVADASRHCRAPFIHRLAFYRIASSPHAG